MGPSIARLKQAFLKGPLAVSTIGLLVVSSPAVTAHMLLSGQRSEISVDRLEVPSEDKDVFAALDTDTVRLRMCQKGLAWPCWSACSWIHKS